MGARRGAIEDGEVPSESQLWLYLRNAPHVFAKGSTSTTRPLIFEPAPITFFTCSEPMFAGNETEDGENPLARSNRNRQPCSPAGSSSRLILPKRVGEFWRL